MGRGAAFQCAAAFEDEPALRTLVQQGGEAVRTETMRYSDRRRQSTGSHGDTRRDFFGLCHRPVTFCDRCSDVEHCATRRLTPSWPGLAIKRPSKSRARDSFPVLARGLIDKWKAKLKTTISSMTRRQMIHAFPGSAGGPFTVKALQPQCITLCVKPADQQTHRCPAQNREAFTEKIVRTTPDRNDGLLPA